MAARGSGRRKRKEEAARGSGTRKRKEEAARASWRMTETESGGSGRSVGEAVTVRVFDERSEESAR